MSGDSADIEALDLPVSDESLRIARSHTWYPVTKDFNKVFYACLKLVGVSSVEAGDAIADLGRFKGKPVLTAAQVRGAYGLEKGVFTEDGRFDDAILKRVRADISVLVEAGLVVPEGGAGSSRTMSDGVIDSALWGQMYADAISNSEHLPAQELIDDEFGWVYANLMRWPKFETAPSKGAVNSWLIMHQPGNGSMLNDFVKMQWTRRLSSRPPKDAPRVPSLSVDDTRGSDADAAAEKTAEQMADRLEQDLVESR